MSWILSHLISASLAFMGTITIPIRQMEKQRLKLDKPFAERFTHLSRGKTRIWAPATWCQRPRLWPPHGTATLRQHIYVRGIHESGGKHLIFVICTAGTSSTLSNKTQQSKNYSHFPREDSEVQRLQAEPKPRRTPASLQGPSSFIIPLCLKQFFVSRGSKITPGVVAG